jgi:hypothetical protein
MKTPTRTLGLLAAAALLGAGPTMAAEPAIHLDHIEARLLYETSGQLSENVAPPSEFALWNSVIGEGSAREPASDVLVSVVLVSDAEQATGEGVLTILVRDAKGKVLATRRFDGLFINAHRAVRSVLVPDASCAGPVTIEATWAGRTKKTDIDFACGE